MLSGVSFDIFLQRFEGGVPEPIQVLTSGDELLRAVETG
jgi:hypothetical protein